MVQGKNQPYHFVLIHGAWCWYKVVTRLRWDGHRVTSLDMAAAGAHPNRVEQIRTLSDYCNPLIEFMSALPPPEKVVLVGHSMGGYDISAAMERSPAKIVAAFMPGLALTFCV